MPKNSQFAAAIGALIVLLLLQTGAVQAQGATRTWVSGVGDDVNPCSRTAPCKTFAGAISKTAAGGEISVLDPGGFGAVTITKSISIVSEGSEGSILASGTSGIVINAGANDVVNLHGLFIEGAGTGINGIRVVSASRVLIRNSLIRGFLAAGGSGILVNPTTNPVQVTVTDTAISNNVNGVSVTPTGAVKAFVHLERVTVEGNTTFGLRAAANNAVIRMNQVLVSGNGTGLSVATGGAIQSFGTNAIRDNTTNGAPTLTAPLQ